MGGVADHQIHNSFSAYYRTEIANVDPGPLWFVAALLIFSSVYAVYRHLRRHSATKGPLVIKARLIVFMMLGVTIATFLIRFIWPLGSYQVLGLNLWSWPQYIVLFSLGWIGGERSWRHRLDRQPRRVCIGAILIALVALASIAVGSGLQESNFLGGWHWGALAMSAVEGLLSVGMSLFILDWFSRHGNWTSGVWASTGHHSYRAYVIHGPLLVGLALLLQDVAISGYAKFVLVCVLGISLSFSVAAWTGERALSLARQPAT
jgi:peptidoglycan/LPS O-acetylase OafA/YrhL